MEQKSLFSEENFKKTKAISAKKAKSAKKPVSKPAIEPKVYTVSQVNTLIKTALENSLPGRLTIAAEISGFKSHRSGHCYFDLKDENSVMPAVMWKSAAGKLKFAPDNGLAVLAKGYVDVYPPQGKYQFYVESMKPAGIGELQLAFEQMREKLKAEGLFDDAHKRPLPKYPQRIGILTSESGAALHDITDSIFNRWPIAKLYLYPVPVQGAGASKKIASAISEINKRNKNLKLDLLIVGRGGGSMEDLWAFNEEPVARAIFASKIPIISAVGHEVDVTIADLVADERASTPTKAGVIAVPDIDEIFERINAVANRLSADVRSRLGMAAGNLETILASAAFRNPLYIVNSKTQIVDELEGRLNSVAKQAGQYAERLIQSFYEKLLRIEPSRLISQKKISLNNLRSRMESGYSGNMSALKLQLESQAGRLSGLNPKNVLDRGYSITRNSRTGALVKNSADIDIDDILITELKDNNLVESRVTKK
ncbi:MAG: exodeoxyribonuclease VII large subunit [Anaerohalosphaeraceae bacterium]|nr:exodeoxyribonuclease VII large subunit [Anaerohalosphaeraceae bacterium]